MPSYIISFLFIVGYFIHLPVSFSDNGSRYSPCSSKFDCGKRINVSYPFWGIGEDDFCGRPGFELKCLGGSLDIEIGSETYVVRDIFRGRQTLRVSPRYIGYSDCPYYGNISLSSDIFHIISKNVTFAECSSTPQVSNIYPFSCYSRNFNDTTQDYDHTYAYWLPEKHTCFCTDGEYPLSCPAPAPLQLHGRNGSAGRIAVKKLGLGTVTSRPYIHVDTPCPVMCNLCLHGDVQKVVHLSLRKKQWRDVEKKGKFV